MLSQFQGKSQYDKSIDETLRPSACGPVTASVILQHMDNPLSKIPINQLYKLLGTTRIGLFTWRFVHRLQQLLGTGWQVRKCSFSEAVYELDSGRPVAAKFDKWFSFNWNGGYEFNYHWVPVIGYEKNASDVTLILHDNGSPSSTGNIRHVSYRVNHEVLSFVKIAPLNTSKRH
ncbi:C39 family peptidase [Sporosarcina sp. A2]|uniref:C39 family peptidase n=1 Tax=Sporosarcina sp. A2 TaxID=3393449 RepID=UPI003D7BBBD1